MATVKILLYQDPSTTIQLEGDQAATGGDVTISELSSTVGTGESFKVTGSLAIPFGLLTAAGPAASVFRFAAGTGPKVIDAAMTLAGTTFFGKGFAATPDLKVAMELNIPGPAGSTSPFAVISCVGEIQVSSTVAATIALGFKVIIDDLPAAFPVGSPPALEIDPPALFALSPVRIPWSFPRVPDFPIRIPASALSPAAIPVRVGWKSIVVDVNAAGALTVTIVGLNLTSTQLTNSVQADVKAAFPGGGAAPQISITNVSASGQSLPDLTNVTYLKPSSGCTILGWTGAPAGLLLGLVSSELSDGQDPTKNQFLLRFGGGTGGGQEVRLDWTGTVAALPRTLGLPGFNVSLPQIQMASLIAYSPPGGSSRRLALAMTIPAGQTLTAGSTFTWSSTDPSDSERDLHQAANGQPSDPPLLTVSSTTKIPVSVVLTDLPLGAGDPPKFFKQLSTSLVPLSTTPPAAGGTDPCTPSAITLGPLTTGAWTIPKFTLNAAVTQLFKFPFLNSGDDASSSPGPLGQFLAINGFDPPTPHLPLPPTGALTTVFDVTLHITIQIGNAISLAAQVTLEFDLESFSFKVDHDKGITFGLPKPLTGEFLGLKWTFAPSPTATQDSPFPAFILVTKGANYQLKQAPGASLSIAFDRATSPDEPIVFNVTNFALTPSGVDLDATVTSQLARLNGLETKFGFTDGKFQIRSNRITDFSIAGSGPLPDALVGPATADIALQFGERSGALQLLAGSAKLQTTKPLRCNATRFEFEIDSIGLKFVDDGGYHLYFTLSGSAKYAPLASDDSSGPLAWLPAVQIQLIDCPLTGNMTVIAKHVKFLVELPKKVSFHLLGCFEMELRAISFLASTEGIFPDNAAAMQITGQVKFAEGAGDVIDAKIDFHNLYVGLPAPGSILPRLHLKGLDIKIKSGEAFALEGAVDFLDNDQIAPGLTASGFDGKGSVTISGLPTLSATFAFLRVSPDSGVTWLRAWFIYLEVDQISIQIPVVEIYIREIGLGFGYRFTLASIKTADEVNDPKALIQALTQLSLTQGNLSDVSSWKVDVEAPGESARWTVALRAMISQTSASAGITDYNQTEEADLPCLFLLDAVLALRSDLTFFMVARAWIDTNYNDFVTDSPAGLRDSPLFSAFILLSARRKLFLAHMASNQKALFGDHPPLPDFLKSAITDSRFSATLLVQPGLFHAELGWPNMLQWHGTFGPLTVDFRGGTIFRVSTSEIVNGLSFLARGTLQLSAGVDLGFVGASLEATASVAYGARYIGVLSFVDPFNKSAFYAAIGIEINVSVSVSFWIKINLLFTKIELNFSFSFAVNFTASLEVGITFRQLVPVGVRGSATIGISIMGHDLHFGVRIGLNEDAVNSALAITNPFLNVGLEATDGSADQIPGTPGATPAITRARHTMALRRAAAPSIVAESLVIPHVPAATPAAVAPAAAVASPGATTPASALSITAPPYHINSVPVAGAATNRVYLLLLPAGQIVDAHGNFVAQNGFYAVPPDVNTVDLPTYTADYAWTIPAPPPGQSVALSHYKFNPDPTKPGTWEPVTPGTTAFTWKSNWKYGFNASTFLQVPADSKTPSNPTGIPQSKVPLLLRQFLNNAFITDEDQKTAPPPIEVHPAGDPVLPEFDPSPRTDARVQNPDESAYEAAVLGAVKQVVPAPYFRRDPDSPYEQKLTTACSNQTSIYNPSGKNDTSNPLYVAVQRAKQLRGSVLQAIIRDFQKYAALARDPNPANQAAMAALESTSLAFQLGMVFRADGQDATPNLWLVKSAAGTIIQRTAHGMLAPNPAAPQPVSAFNTPETGFATSPPEFTQVKQFAHANSVAFNWVLKPTAPPSGSQAASFAAGDPRLDPEHLLQYYKVHRIRIDGNEAPGDFTVKKADVLHLPVDPNDPTTKAGVPIRLLSRFQFVDHFATEVADDADALTDAGKTYLYTITPVDVVGQESPRPLSLVVTRYPCEPPQAPTDGEFVVAYEIDDPIPTPADTPLVHEPVAVVFRWSTPSQPSGQSPVGIAAYQLVFRRESTVPIGFFGSDGETQGSVAAGLPTSNARPLRTDVIVPLVLPAHPPTLTDPSTNRKVNAASIPIALLEQKGILPTAAADGRRPWRPEAWRIFAQSVSVAQVPSALAPVGLVYRFLPTGAKGLPLGATPADPITLVDWTDQPRYEERRPSLLEWIADPVGLGPLPPRDVVGDPGFLQAPMPNQSTGPIGVLQSADGPEITGLAFLPSPDRRRAVRFLWNQGPSQNPDHPIDLHARYQLYEFDADAHTGESLDVPAGDKTLMFSDWVDNAGLRLVQEVELLAPDQLALTPSDINAPITWEAWYPSVARRQQLREAMMVAGTWPKSSPSPYSPWYSWRDSYLVWPDLDQGAGLSQLFSSDTAAPVVIVPTGTTVIPPLELAFITNSITPSTLALVSASTAIPIQLTAATNNLQGVVNAVKGLTTAVTPAIIKRVISGAAESLLSLQPANPGTTSIELRTKPGDSSTSLVTREMLVQVNIPVNAIGVPTPNGSGTPVPVARRTRPCHPFLQRVVTLLAQPVGQGPAPVVELNPPPPRLDEDTSLDNLFQGTDPQPDPYGWGILRRFGLAIAFRLRNPDSTYVEATDLFSRVGIAVTEALNEIDPTQTLAPHVHVEHLFQAGRRYQLGRNETDASLVPPQYSDLLALVMVSLRPTIQQRFFYRRVVISRPPPDPSTGAAPVALITIFVNDAVGASYKVRVGDDNTGSSHGGGNTSADTTLATGSKVQIALPFPPTGSGSSQGAGDVIVLLFRALQFNTLGVAVGPLPTPPAPLTLLPMTPFTPTDWDSTYFEAPDESLFIKAPGPAGTGSTDLDASFWNPLGRYVQGMRPLNAPNATNDLGIPWPPNVGSPDRFPDVLTWLARFFDYGGDVPSAAGLASTAAGPFLASAYPRAATPVAITPDAANRIETYEPINDLWGHIYRYYVKPMCRYDLLWLSLAGSRALIQDKPDGTSNRPANLRLLDTIPSPELGGLDVVFDRIRPLAAPLVLSSRRLDSAVPAGQVAPPGKVWEVLVAKHTEQILIERNRSLADHLSYRQTAHTLLRQFTYSRAQVFLGGIVSSTYSPLYDAPKAPVTPTAISKLELVVGSAMASLHFDGNNDVAGVVRAVNAAGLPVTATALPAIGLRLRVNLQPPVSEAQLRTTPGDAASDILFHPSGGGPAYGPISLNPAAPTAPVVPTTPTTLELFVVSGGATKSKTFSLSAAQNNIAGVAAAMTALGLDVNAAAEAYGLQFKLDSTTPGVDVQLRTTAGDPTSDLLSRTFALQLQAPVTTTLPAIPAAPDAPDALAAADLSDPDSAAPANLPARLARFAQGVAAIQFQALPFYYTHRLLLVAQAAAVVSPATELLQADFHFVSPPAVATMEAVPSPGGLPRKRRILITLARFWDGLDSDAQRRWAVENPQSSSGKQRFVGMMPDPEVAYQIVVAHPSGLTESVAVVRSEAAGQTTASGPPPKPVNPAGFQVIQVPKTFILTAVRILPPADVDDAGRESMQLETLLNRVGGPDEDAITTTQPVSSRGAFVTASANVRVSFPPPSSLSLRVVAPLTAGDLTELRALGSSTVARDQSFRTAVGILTAAITAGTTTPETIAALGLEALAEISITVVLPTEANRNIVWTGLMSQDQHNAVAGWAGDSGFRQTFQALLKAADAAVITVTYSAPVTKPTNADLPALLRPVLSVTNTQLTWTGLLMTDAQSSALLSLQQDATQPQPFRDAAAKLLAEATTPTAASKVTVAVVEADWHPRPTAKDLSASLAGKLLIGVGQIAFRGLMTRDEGKALQKVVASSAPDVSAIDVLFFNTLNSGLNGGELTVRTRRGGAPNESALVQANL